MPTLIAQGPQPQDRLRRSLTVGEAIVVGRDSSVWTVDWDERISRRHAELTFRDDRLHVRRLPTGRNPIFVAGSERDEFDLGPGEHFVIGETSFTFNHDSAQPARDMPEPVEEQTFSSQYLRRIAYRNADQRLEVLSRLPEVISGAVNDEEMVVRLVNLLLAGIPRAGAAAVTAVDDVQKDDGQVRVLHWDRRQHLGSGDFRPSRRLIVDAVRRRQSVLHVWNTGGSGSGQFTMSEEADWAFATPIGDEAEGGWALYVAGRYHSSASLGATPTDPTDLREDLKFSELAAAILAALRQTEQLRRRQRALSGFFAPAVLRALQGADPDVVLAPREADVSVMFCDLRGFTRAAQRNADDLLGLLERVSRALGVTTHHILEQGGVLGDFHGDAAMGFWGWPLPQADAVTRACAAALAVRREFEAASGQAGHTLVDFHVGIGMAAGRAVAGKIGTSDQVKVTVFGPVVNLASRLEGLTKTLHAPILIDETLAAAVRREVPPSVARCRRVARILPYGSDVAVEASELLPPVAEFPDLSDEQLGHYEQALDHFIAGRWSEALELLHFVPAKDRVKDFLTVYIVQNGRTPPPNWDGIVKMTSK